jgi:metallo-beta-lactamase class B
MVQRLRVAGVSVGMIVCLIFAPVATNLITVSMVAASLGAVILIAQPADTAAAHRAAAKAAAGQDFPGLLRTVCPETPGRGGAGQATAAAPQLGRAAGDAAARGRGTGDAAPVPRQSPPRELWHAEPVKVFDNLYFVGQTEYSAWAVNTSDGIIIIDTIFDYSVEDEVVGGLKKLGLDPARIKYLIVSHGHFDHSGGAKFLQDTYKAHVLMSAADWDLLDRGNQNQPRPKRDMVVTDGETLTLGDTTLTMYLTPGHTPGTISTLIPVKDNGRPHLMAEWGGTAFNFTVTPDKPRDYWFRTYIASAEHFRDAAVKAGADGVIANHTIFDESKRKLPALAKRRTGDQNPYVTGTEAVELYLRVAEECAKAGLAELQRR